MMIAYLLVMSLVAPSLVRRQPDGISTRVVIISPVKLGAPNSNDVHEPLEENLLNLLVQFGHPLIKICVAFQVEPVNLPKKPPPQSTEEIATKKKHAYSRLDSTQEITERLRCVRARRKILHGSKDVFVEINHIIRFVLSHHLSLAQLSD